MYLAKGDRKCTVQIPMQGPIKTKGLHASWKQRYFPTVKSIFAFHMGPSCQEIYNSMSGAQTSTVYTYPEYSTATREVESKREENICDSHFEIQRIQRAVKTSGSSSCTRQEQWNLDSLKYFLTSYPSLDFLKRQSPLQREKSFIDTD